MADFRIPAVPRPTKIVSDTFGDGGTGLTDGQLTKAIALLSNLTTHVVEVFDPNWWTQIPGLKETDIIQSIVQLNPPIHHVPHPNDQESVQRNGDSIRVIRPNTISAYSTPIAALTSGAILSVTFFRTMSHAEAVDRYEMPTNGDWVVYEGF